MDWFRSYVGTSTDPKFRVVAKKSGARLGDVLAIWQMLLERACGADERGRVDGFDCEGADALLDLEDGTACAVYAAMESKGVVKSGHIAAWEKRQPKREREDDSSSRVKAYRERQKQASNATCGNVTPCNATQRQETPRLEESRGELNNRVSPLPPVGGDGQELTLPPSPEDDPDALPAVPEISSLNDCAIEFQELAAAFQSVGGCVDVVPAYKAFLAVRHNFPLARIVDDLDKRRNCDQWQRGKIPKLSNYLADRVWLNPIPAARASPPGPHLTPRQKQTEMFKGMAQAIKRADGAGNGENNGGRRVEGALPAGAALPRS
ncbi:hypothetical protein [Solidesulfovibrio sp.]